MKQIVINYKSCDAIMGFNTKQWWAYDNENDLYIDPPLDVLNEIKAHSNDYNEQESYFLNIINKNPDWLQDSDYWYDGEI